MYMHDGGGSTTSSTCFYIFLSYDVTTHNNEPKHSYHPIANLHLHYEMKAKLAVQLKKSPNSKVFIS